MLSNAMHLSAFLGREVALPIDEIIANIEPTAEIVSRIKPIYHFKAGDEEEKL